MAKRNLMLLRFASNLILQIRGIEYPGRNPVLQRYLKRQLNDDYNKLAREHSFRARSAFKLIEMNAKHKIVKPGIA